MGRKCAISVCLSDSNRDADRGVTFHKIPMHPDIRPKWMSLCRIPEDKKLMKVIYVCSRHFLNADFCNFKGKKYMLKQGVLPSVFPWSKQSKTDIRSEQIAPPSEIEPEIKIEEGESEINVNSESFNQIEEPEVKIEIPESDFNAALSLKTEDSPSNMNKELLSPHQSTTIEQKVKTIDTTTGPLTFAPNIRIEALDFNQSWCPARILEVDYQENEVLVHFDKYSSKYDEWICMNSSTLRALPPVVQQQGSAKKITLYEVGERCLASWSDSRKFPATVAKVLEKDSYEVHFDDGFTKVLKSHRMAKAAGKPMQLSPLFNPARGSKQERRDRKRKLNVAALFGKRVRAGSQDDRNASSTDLDDAEYWTPKWENGRPVGENSVIEMHDGPKKSIIVPDPRLPPHWVKHLTQRTHGASSGKWDTVIVNPEGRRFRMRNEIKSFIEEHSELNLSEGMFDFAIYRRSKKSSESRKSAAAETIVHEPATEPLTEDEPPPYNLNSLKIPLVDNGYKCPIEGCGKNFRRENLAQMHVKHYHPEYTKYLDSTPNVADLAYARTVGESLDRSPGPDKPRTTNPKLIPKMVTPKTVPHENDSQNSLFKVRDSEIIKLLSSKPNELRPDGPISPILPSGLPPSMYPDIKLKDLLTKSEAIPKRDDLNLKALSTHRPTGYKTLTHRDDFDEHPSSSRAQSRPLTTKRKKIFPEHFEALVKKEEAPLMSLETPPPLELLNPTNNVIIEGGEVIKIVQMKREEIINCTCGITEEDGLMIQCELCLCWQHAYCNNIQRESEVPEKYVCYICQNPMRQRSSKKYFHDQDWLKHGTLATGNYHCKDEAVLKERFEKLKRSHDLSGGLLEVKDYLHTLRVKIKIAMDKNHPKSYLWSKPWEKQPLPEKMEVDEKPELPEVEIKSEENDSMLLTLLKSKDIPTEPADFPKLDLNTLIGNNMENISALQAPRIPEPEAAIDSADCRLNLLEHIAHSQSLVEERLSYFEEQIDKLEGAFEDEDNDENYSKLRQTTRMLMRDLTVVKELSQMSTF